MTRSFWIARQRDDLIVGALQERADRHDGAYSRQSPDLREGDGMLFGDGDVKIAIREFT